jgi:hypothetical protein
MIDIQLVGTYISKEMTDLVSASHISFILEKDFEN